MYIYKCRKYASSIAASRKQSNRKKDTYTYACIHTHTQKHICTATDMYVCAYMYICTPISTSLTGRFFQRVDNSDLNPKP